MSDEYPMELAEMLAAVTKIEVPPDYRAIVKKDWAAITDALKDNLRVGVKNDVLPGISDKYQDPANLEYNIAIIVDGKLPVSKSIISAVLTNFPDNIIFQIAKVVWDRDLNSLWNQTSHAAIIKIENAKRKREQLASTRQKLCGVLTPIKNELMDCALNKRGYPEIVLQPIEDAFRSLTNSLKLAEAYIELLDEEIKTGSNKGYTTKHHPVWKTIYKPVASIIQEAQEANPELKNESHINLTAKLMAAVYPWYWGDEVKGMNHRRATKNIGDGIRAKD